MGNDIASLAIGVTFFDVSVVEISRTGDTSGGRWGYFADAGMYFGFRFYTHNHHAIRHFDTQNATAA